MGEYAFQRVEGYMLPLWDFGWLDVSVYKVEGLLDTRYDAASLFSSLLSHRVYRDSYMESRHWEKDSAGIHGPFLIEKLSPTDFLRVPFDKVGQILESHFDDPAWHTHPSEKQRTAVEAFLRSLSCQNLDCYWLNVKEKEDRFHDFFFVLLVFEEFVFLDPVEATLRLVVLGYD